MNTWFLIAALFNIHTGELNVVRNPVAGFQTPQECSEVLINQGPRKPNAKGEIILYECVGPADSPEEHLSVKIVMLR